MENLKFLASFFGSFNQSDFHPSSENQKYYLDKLAFLGQMIPNVVQEISPTGQQNHLGMSSINKSWNITFHSTRINIEKNNAFGQPITKADFIDNVKSIVENINNKTRVQFNRIGFVSKYIVKNKKQSEISQIYFLFNLPSSYYEGTAPVEWVSKVISRKDVDFLDRTELLNASTEIKSIQGVLMRNNKPEPINGLEMGFDVNSFQNNQTHRFTTETAKEFLDLLASEENRMLESVKQKMKTNKE